MKTTPIKGQRKIKVNTQTQLLLVAMFALAVWLKADPQVCLMFVAGVVGAFGFFAWGNRGEHAADAQKFEAAAKYGRKAPEAPA